MDKNRKPLGTLALIALAAILLSAVVLAVDVDAARGGKGNGGGGNGGSTATVSVAPNPVPAWGEFTVTGSGFFPNQVIYVNATCRGVFNLVADSNGNFSWWEMAGEPQTCHITFSQQSGRKIVEMATLTFSIV